MPEFSAAIQDLIQKARIVSFGGWQSTHPAEAIALFQAADDQRRYLTDADIQHLQTLVPNAAVGLELAVQLRDLVIEIVNAARIQVLEKYPELIEPGGALYPEERAEACWRDFWHFLRCITYGIAGQHPDYLSQVGLHHLEQLYQELRVPLTAMILGLRELKSASLQRLPVEQHPTLAPYFDHLISHMQYFEDD